MNFRSRQLRRNIGSRASAARAMGVVIAVAAAAGIGGAAMPAVAEAACKSGTVCEAKINVKIKGKGKSKRGSLRQTGIGQRVQVTGTVRPYVSGQKITVRLKQRGKTAFRRSVKIKRGKGGRVGTFKVRTKMLDGGGPYVATAKRTTTSRQKGGSARTPKLRIAVPGIGPRSPSGQIRLLQRWLKRLGYYVPRSGNYDDATRRAVLAFRKVNRMPRTTSASKQIVRMLSKRKGGYKVKFPKNGRHVESDLSRQIMVLVDKGKAQHIFHVSTGASVTPTLRGNFRFYRYEPGLNSLGMYYSVYYDRGYAIHGYKSVPTYPASHGCLRNPMSDSKFIYDWVSIGMPINIY